MSYELATVKEFGLVLALAAAEYEREQCCKDVCGHCDDGNLPIREEYKKARFVTFDSFGDLMHYCWRHREAEFAQDRIVGCDASAIRERAYQQARIPLRSF